MKYFCIAVSFCILISSTTLTVQAAGLGTILGTDIHGAARKGNLKKIKKLVEKKNADVNARNNSGNTGLEFAAWKGHLDIVTYLLEKGAEIDNQDNHGQTALQLASTWGHSEVTSLLISKGANLELESTQGRTALIRAAMSGHAEIVQQLLAAGADPSVQDIDGKTALYYGLNLRDEIAGKSMILSLLESNSSEEQVATARAIYDEADKSREVEAEKRANPTKCVEKDNPELSENDNKAVRYLIRKKFADQGLGTKERLCVEYIHVKDSIVIRGEKVITYTAELMFPQGHLTKCLDKRATQGSNWVSNSECWMGVGLKPQRPGARGNWDGESTI